MWEVFKDLYLHFFWAIWWHWSCCVSHTSQKGGCHSHVHMYQVQSKSLVLLIIILGGLYNQVTSSESHASFEEYEKSEFSYFADFLKL